MNLGISYDLGLTWVHKTGHKCGTGCFKVVVNFQFLLLSSTDNTDIVIFLLTRWWWYSQLWWLLRSLMGQLSSRLSTRLSDSQMTMTVRTKFFRLFTLCSNNVLQRCKQRFYILLWVCCLCKADAGTNWYVLLQTIKTRCVYGHFYSASA